MMKRVFFPVLAALLGPAAAVEVVIGQQEQGSNIPFCGT